MSEKKMGKSIKFIKMQGIGNDFVLIDGTKENLGGINLESFSIQVCDRHFGIGADGLLVVLPSEKADYKMRIFNADGSEAEMCGNGIRCFVKYIYDTSKDKKDVYSVETLAGIMVPAVIAEKGIAIGAEVDMGEPKLKRPEIPMKGKDKNKVVDEDLKVNGKTLKVTCLSMGNPHCVLFYENLDKINIAELGPKIENHKAFPQRTNVEFVEVLKDNEINVKVWERGAGETLACGTGACAALVACVLNEKTKRRALVHLPGGNLDIEWEEEDNHVAMRGPAKIVFEGTYFA